MFPNDKSDPQHLLKLTSRMIGLSRINISFHKNFKNIDILARFLKKLLTQHKKVTKFSVILPDDVQKSPRFWNKLMLLKYLQHLELTNITADDQNSLVPFLKFLKLNRSKNYWPKIQQQYIFLSAFKACRNRAQIKESLQNLKDNLHDMAPWVHDESNNIKLTLNFKRLNQKPELDILLDIADLLGKIPNLACLKISGKVGSNFVCIVDHLPELKTLQVLSFIFLKQSPTTLNALPQFVNKIKTLTALGVNLDNKDGMKFLDQFTADLGSLSHIKDLIITLGDAFSLSDLTLSSLAIGLSGLKELETLKVYKTETTNTLNFEGVDVGIQSIFESLASLSNLKGLSIIFEGLVGYLRIETIRALCNSLRNLKKLKQLKLVFSYSNIDSQGLLLLGRTLKDLHNIEELAIMNYQQESEKDMTFIDFLNYLSKIPNIMNFQLELKCESVDENLGNAIIKTICGYKSLNYFLLQIQRRHGGSEAENLLKKKLSELNQTHFEINKFFNPLVLNNNVIVDNL